MRRFVRIAAAAAVLGVLPGVFAATGGPAPGAMATTANDYVRGDLRLLTDNGDRFSWGDDDNIYFDREGADGYVDIWKVPSGGGTETCITCNDTPVNRQHGLGRLRPDGSHRWLVYQRELDDHGYGPPGLTVPGVGLYNELWAKDLTTGTNYPLHNVADGIPAGETPGGTLLPHFNSDGSKLLWSDRVGPGGVGGGTDFDNMRLGVADFVVTAGVPSLQNKSWYQPTNNGRTLQWRESSGWANDGSSIHFACADQPGMYNSDMDMCQMSFANPSAVTRLTQSSGTGGEPREWDEHMQISPVGDARVWMTSRDVAPGYVNPTSITMVADNLKTDLWIANLDGTSARRLTTFNDPKSSDWLGSQAIVSDMHWNQAGTQLALHVQTETDPNITDRTFIMDLVHGHETGWRNATANAVMAGNGFEQTPTNAYADGGGTANNINGVNDAHRYNNYGFGIPAGSAVKRVQVRLDWRSDSTAWSPKFDVDLSWNGGVSWTSAKATAVGTTTDATYSVATPFAGHAFAQPDFTDANFRVRVTSRCSIPGLCGGRDWFLDWAAVNVTYSP